MRSGRRFETRELLLIVFFAAFLVAARAAMRWHLHIAGHAMLASAFGLVLVRSCVDRRGAATLCGLVSGAVVAALGMGEGGPLIVLKLALPGAVIDLGAWMRPRAEIPLSISRGLVLGALAGLAGLVPMVLVEWLADVEGAVIALHVITSGVGKSLFGAAGGAAGAWVARELAHHGLLGAESTQPAGAPR